MVALTTWVFGISLAAISCFLSALGLTLQRKSALRQEALPEFEEALDTPPRRRCYSLWLLGVIVYIIAALPDFISYLLIPQVICSAVSCFRLVVVTVMACIVLGERLTLPQALGMGLCTLGTCLCLVFGPVRMEKALITSQFSSPKVTIYLALGALILLALLMFDHLDSFFSNRGRGVKLSGRCRNFTLPLLTGLAFATSKVLNSEIGFLPFPHDAPPSAQWLGMAAGIAFLGLIDFYLNMRATRLMSVQVFVPVSFVWSIGLQYFQSVVLFRELAELSSIHVVLSCGGAFMSLLGAICIQVPNLAVCGRHNQAAKVQSHEAASRSISGVSLQEELTTNENDRGVSLQEDDSFGKSNVFLLAC